MCNKIFKIFGWICLLALFACIPVYARDQSSGDDVNMEEYYHKVAMPGPAHDILAGLEGNWSMSVILRSSPDAEPMKFVGSTDNKMILGGRFLECRSVSGEGEMHTESLSIYGYDNRYGEYTIVGFDTWGTYFVTAQGSIDEDEKTIVMYGSDADPIMGFDQEYSMTLEIIDSDHYRSTVSFTNPELTGGEDEFEMVEIICTRIK